MTTRVTIVVSSEGHRDLDAPGLSDLIFAYHRQTESEKGMPITAAAELPEPYRREVDDPRAAFRGQTVFVAMIGAVAAGCVVMTAPRGDCCEIKRLWTDPAARGRGVATRLIDAAVDRATDLGVEVVRLTVWHWRAGAIDLYERLGFVRSPPWEEREGLVCLQRHLPGGA